MPNSSNLAHRCRSLLAVLGCALTFASQAVPTGRHALRGHVPAATRQLTPLGKLEKTNRLRLALGLPLRNSAGLTNLLRDLYAPSSARFHQYLKPSEFTGQFGPTEQDYATLTAFAQSHGLKVVQTHANRLILDVEGSVADIQKAFHVNINVFQHPTEPRTFYAPDAEPAVEKGLPLEHVSGLDNYQLPKSLVVPRPGGSRFNATTGSGPGGDFLGGDFRAAYAPGVTNTGAGQVQALVEFDTFFTSDILAYESLAKLPSVPITQVPVDGFNQQPGGGDAEVSLDIEMAISMAPGLSQVLVYEAPYGSLSVNNDLLNQIAVDDVAKQISCCWIYTIDSTSDSIFLEMAAQGQSFFTACGDDGAFYYDPQPLLTDPNITIVGGTDLTTAGNGGPLVSETVWNRGGSLSGAGSGGVSVDYLIPYWQQSVNMSSNQGSTIWRNVPDISMVADDVWINFDNGSSETVGGTSCASPLWAGFTALINQQAAQYGRPPVGFINPALYGLAQSALYSNIFNDITNGNNTNSSGSTKFFATPGYDLCTGWGTPAGQPLINAFAPPDTMDVSPQGGCSFDATNDVALLGVSQTMVLKNTATGNIEWQMGPRPSWLSVSETRGLLSGSLATIVTFSLNNSATNLPPGNYLADLLVTNRNAGITHIFPVALQVSDPLVFSPNLGLTATGPVGAAFTNLTQTFVLTNMGSQSLQWTAQSASIYASFDPFSGTLLGGAVTNITLTVNPEASNLLISALGGDLTITDQNTGFAQSQPFSLLVGNGGFETGDFSDWNFSGDSDVNFAGSVLDIFYPYVHSGEYAAFLGEPDTTASLSQILPTTPGQAYLISFFLDNPVGGPVNEFIVKWGASTLYQRLEVNQMGWTNMQFAVAATNTATTLEFDFRNDPDAFGLDDVSVTAISPPSFTSVVSSNGATVFTWNATPGFGYQLKYATNLIAPKWINVAPVITATNSVVTVTDTQHTDAQRFYRIRVIAP